jgi:hypothetical protein
VLFIASRKSEREARVNLACRLNKIRVAEGNRSTSADLGRADRTLRLSPILAGFWLLEQGSNLQALRHLINSQARLPVPPSRKSEHLRARTTQRRSRIFVFLFCDFRIYSKFL